MAVKSNVKTAPVNMEERKNADIRTGDTVRVHTKVVEKGKTRTQPFEGLVIARKHGTEPGATFTVRRTSGDYGVERIFPLYSPNIAKIDILRRSKVRQANVYHIRRKVAKQIRREMRRMTLMGNTLADESVDENGGEEDEAANEQQESAEQEETQAKQTETTQEDNEESVETKEEETEEVAAEGAEEGGEETDADSEEQKSE